MFPLVKIRSERDQMSAVERRIADFLLDNAGLLRDYSSQQLANALGISQSSVVKFSQKLGFKGYPDLKYSIGEAIARADTAENGPNAASSDSDEADDPASQLWRRKAEAEQATRLLNPPDVLAAAAAAISGETESGERANKVFLIGFGVDDIHARAFAMKLALLGISTVHNFDAARMAANVSSVTRGDVLMVFSEHGQHPALCKISHWVHEHHGKVVTVSRNTANPLRAMADVALVVSAHDEAAEIEPLLYQSALHHLLDGVFLQLCQDRVRRENLRANLDRIQNMLGS
ncbi:MAG: MurR/RpiR family transcriptional regulator [Xanthomonadales bacterium]|nr:MurR/RpiR family transcriptional regulator [Xanthomonadales bacterium]